MNMSEEQIVDDIIATKLSANDFAFLKSFQKENLIALHHSFGRSIRNTYDLWQRDWVPEIEDGIDVSPNHPDAVSMRIIETVWERINA